MDSKDDAFSEEYFVKSGTDVPSKPDQEKKQDETTGGQIGYYDKSKPYRVFIRAKEVKQ